MKKISILVVCSLVSSLIFIGHFKDSYSATFDDVWLVKSLNILEDPPYTKGQNLTAEFTIKNLGLRTIYLDGLMVKARLNKDINNNFYWYRNIPLKSKGTYKYQGNMIFDKPGLYRLDVKYKLYGRQWEKKVKTFVNIEAKKEITIEESSSTKANQEQSKSQNIGKVVQSKRQIHGDKIVLKLKFKDIEGHWSENFVKELYLQDVIEGFNDGFFYPENYVSKNEFAALLCKGIFLKKEKIMSNNKSWSADYINSTINFFNNKDVAQDVFENREELISALVNALKWDEQVDTKIIEDTFVDANKINPLNKKNIALAIKKGLIEGYSDKTFRGQNYITRAEACKLIQNSQLIGGNSKVYDDFIIAVGKDKKVSEEYLEEESPTPIPTIQTESPIPAPTPTLTPINTPINTPNPPIVNPNKIDYSKYENPNSNPQLREERLKYIFGYNQYGEIKKYTTKSEAEGNVQTVEIKVWDFDSSGKNKTTKTMNIIVNNKIADVVKIIFEKIYNDAERFPIKYIASYAWRAPMSSGRLSEHNYGTCLDINPNENPYIVGGVNQSGGQWEPGINPYSISVYSSVLKYFREYKWGWGGADWSSSKDYMHFTYLGH